jgi:glycosyltransferase involved in cell wall biosynthesis
MTSSQLTIVVPVFNEADVLPAFLPELEKFIKEKGYQLIFVDDASTDNSWCILQSFCDQFGHKLLRHKVNRGYGGALKTGIRACVSEFVVTMDADGQHRPEDAVKLFEFGLSQNADMVVGRRKDARSGLYRAVGRRLIRFLAGRLIELPVEDLNSGMKLYRTSLAKRYLVLCPDSMAFSDIITLVFIHRNSLVLEIDISVRMRAGGKSTISTMTAIETVFEILNVVAMFNPGRIFLPLGVVFSLFGLIWGLPFILRNEGVSVGTMLLLVFGLIFFLVAVIAEQVAQLRRGQIKDEDLD